MAGTYFGVSDIVNLFTDPKSSFVSPSIAHKYGFEVPPYEGIDQVVEVATAGQKL